MVNGMSILVTGSKGQLGSSIKEISMNYPHHFYFKDKREMDITNYSFIEKFLTKNNIDTIINCAAYTDVINAEKNKFFSENVNHIGANNLAKLCNEFNIQLIHISTDYVYDGFNNYPYKESSPTNPQNYYGITKLNGEKKILSYNLNKSVIIRTSWLYSKFNNNFVTRILNSLENNENIYVVEDEVGSPTNALDLAKIILEIIPRLSNLKTEIFHFSNLGFCSRYEFAKKIKEIINSKCIVSPTKQKFSDIKRPKFSALDSSKIIENFQLNVKSWEISLENHLKKNIV
tara:strand:+ start:1352 stop:2215 length:864 start_codon:yes stop_codon:yes gene_type:complete